MNEIHTLTAGPKPMFSPAKKEGGKRTKKKDIKMDKKGRAVFLAFSACVPCNSNCRAFNLFLPSCQLSETSLSVAQEFPPIDLVPLLLPAQAGIYLCHHLLTPLWTCGLRGLRTCLPGEFS